MVQLLPRVNRAVRGDEGGGEEERPVEQLRPQPEEEVARAVGGLGRGVDVVGGVGRGEGLLALRI